jgi:hypothetical protein
MFVIYDGHNVQLSSIISVIWSGELKNKNIIINVICWQMQSSEFNSQQLNGWICFIISQNEFKC